MSIADIKTFHLVNGETVAPIAAALRPPLDADEMEEVIKQTQMYWARTDHRQPQAGDFRGVVTLVAGDLKKIAETHGIDLMIQAAALAFARHA